MGGGTWTTSSFVNYTKSVGRSVSATGTVNGLYTAQDMFKCRDLQPELDPHKVIRECRDTDEHPNTIPVILALDVTGSMGSTAAQVAKKLNEVMTQLYGQVQDIEFLVMGIGDLACDYVPIQASQFESDIRIAEQMDKVYFEAGGGGNCYESYTAAWYFGLYHTDLDCWQRGKKGIIITLGDEALNPYLPAHKLSEVLGDHIQADVDTEDLYQKTLGKFDVYHIAVAGDTCYRYHERMIDRTWRQLLDNDHFKMATVDNVAQCIVDIITGRHDAPNDCATAEISW